MAVCHKFYKLHTIDRLLAQTARERCKLMDELVGMATDDIRFMRRFRMLSNLALFESQIIQKIYDFDTQDPEDYLRACLEIDYELNLIIDRNA